MEQDSGVSLETLRVDGGMTDDELLMQFQADVVDRAVVRPKIRETTALGAAFAAGLAVGVFSDLDDLRSRWVESRRWLPHMTNDLRQQLLERWAKAVSRSVDGSAESVDSVPPGCYDAPARPSHCAMRNGRCARSHAADAPGGAASVVDDV